MRLAVITPVGPGHEGLAAHAARSVIAAKACNPGPWADISHVFQLDDGTLGRSAARNRLLVKERAADWYFFLDADDEMMPEALGLCDLTAPATFGAVLLSGRLHPRNVYPCGWPEMRRHGADGTLCMGFFCRGDVARRLRFDESLDVGEDFEFYMRLPGFVKIASPLVNIGYDKPSAGGPRGYETTDWLAACRTFVERVPC